MAWVQRGILAGLFAYLLLVALGSLWWPMGRDQGVFAWVGDEILDGGAPYRDAWEVKGPATHYTFATARLLLGKNLWSIRLFDLILVGVSTAALWHLVRRWADPFAGCVAAMLFVVLYFRDGYWNTAQPDGWASMFLLISLAMILTTDHSSPARTAAAGGLVGLAASYKLLFAAFLIPLLCFSVLARHGSWRERLGRACLLLGACLAVGCLFVLPLAYQGAWADFCDVQFHFNRVVHASAYDLPLTGQISRILGVLRMRILPDSLLVLGLGLGILGLWNRQRLLLTTLLIILLLAFVCVVVQGKYYWYHWRPMYIPVVMIAAIGISRLRDVLGDSPRLGRWTSEASRVVVLLAVAWLVWSLSPGLNAAGWQACVFGSLPREKYYRVFEKPEHGGYPLVALTQAADHLREHTSREDHVQVWGFETLINTLCQRRPPTRFGFNYPLVAAAGTVFEKRYRREFIEDLVSEEPAYIVIMDRDRNNLMPETSKQYLEGFPEFAAYVRANYRLEKTIEHCELWRRKARRQEPPDM